MDFKLPKNIDDISDGELLPEDYYVMRIMKEPVVAENAKAREGLSEEDGAGKNVVLSLRVQSDKPEFNGRGFTKYLGIPNKADKNRFNSFTGQSYEDMKMQSLANWSSAFSGAEASGKGVSFEAGQEAWVYVAIGKDFRDADKDANVLDFNAQPKPLQNDLGVG